MVLRDGWRSGLNGMLLVRGACASWRPIVGVIILSGVYTETESVIGIDEPLRCLGSLYVGGPYWGRRVLDGPATPNAAAWLRH